MASSNILADGKVAAADPSSAVAGRWTMGAYPYQVIGFLIVWLMIVLSMVVAG